SGVVITLMRDRTCLTCPVLIPADVAHMPTAMAGFRRRKPAVSDHQLRPVPARLVGQVTARRAPGRIRESAPSGARPGQALLLQHPRRAESFDHDLAVGL